MADWFIWALSITAIILVFLILLQIFQSIEIRTLQENQRLAIYRLGRFHGIRGPGPVMIIKGLDTHTVPFNVMEQPMEITISGLFINGIPVGLTVDFWAIFDPQQTLGHDRESLNRVFQMKESDRRYQISLRLKDRFAEQIGAITQRESVPGNADLGQKLLPVLPGSTLRSELLQAVYPRFAETIRSLGYRLSMENTMIISQLHLPDGMGEMLNRGRLVSQLRDQFPGLADGELAQILASIEGRESPNIHRYVVDGGVEAQIGTRRRQDNTEEDRFSFRTAVNRDQERPEPMEHQSPTSSQATHTPQHSETPPGTNQIRYALSRSDLDVLKPIPRFTKPTQEN